MTGDSWWAQSVWRSFTDAENKLNIRQFVHEGEHVTNDEQHGRTASSRGFEVDLNLNLK